MIYYSSMTLADYITTNWTSLPKELVDLFEKENERFYDQEEQITEWRENYHDVRDTLIDAIKLIENEIFYYKNRTNSAEDSLANILDICNDVDV